MAMTLASVVSAAGNAAIATHALTVEDLLAVQQVSRVEMSPDGKKLLLVTQGTDLKADMATKKTYLAETRPDQNLLPLPLEAAEAQWEPGGEALTFFKPTEECTQLWRIPIATRQPVQLGNACLPSKDRVLTAHRWSPDGRYVAYLAQPIVQDELSAWSAKATAPPIQDRSQPCLELDSDEARAKGMDALDLACTGTSVGTGWMWGLDVASPALRFFWAVQAPLPPTELWVLEVATGAARRLSNPAMDVRQFDWSGNGHVIGWLALSRNEKRDEKAPYTGGGSSLSFGGEGGIWLSDLGARPDHLRSIDVGALTAIDLYYLGFKLSPDLGQVALGTRAGVRLYATRSSSASRPKEIYKGRVVQFDWSSDSRALYLLRYEHQLQTLMLIDAKSGAARAATQDDRWQGKPSFSANHRTFALTVEDVAEPTRVYLGVAGSPNLREVVGHQTLNPHWQQVAPLVSERIEWRSWDDKWDLYGVTVAPEGPALKTPRPMVVVLLGAGYPAQRVFSIDTQQPVLLLAAAGYTVFIPNDRTRGGVSPRGYEELGPEHTYFSIPWRDDMQGVDLMIAKGIADPHRLGIMGNSYGGGLTSWGIAHTTRFKAAVLKEPVALDMAANWRGVWGQKNWGGDVIGKEYGIDNPYEGEGAQFVQFESPLTTVSEVRTPTLFEFGVKSGNVQLGGNEYYQALVWFGVPAELVMYPRTIHGFLEPTIVADSFRREMKWFEQHLPL